MENGKGVTSDCGDLCSWSVGGRGWVGRWGGGLLGVSGGCEVRVIGRKLGGSMAGRKLV